MLCTSNKENLSHLPIRSQNPTKLFSFNYHAALWCGTKGDIPCVPREACTEFMGLTAVPRRRKLWGIVTCGSAQLWVPFNSVEPRTVALATEGRLISSPFPNLWLRGAGPSTMIVKHGAGPKEKTCDLKDTFSLLLESLWKDGWDTQGLCTHKVVTAMSLQNDWGISFGRVLKSTILYWGPLYAFLNKAVKVYW